jgi:hypothetical protein
MKLSTRVGGLIFAFSALTLSLAATGCGPGKGDVSGIVKYKGQVLKFGSVQFQAESGGLFTSTIDSNGRYEIKGCPGGVAKVMVNCVDEEKRVEHFKRAAAAGKGAMGGAGPAPPTEDPDIYIIVPMTFSDFATSGLTCTVKKGIQTHDIIID